MYDRLHKVELDGIQRETFSLELMTMIECNYYILYV